ncbi:hypothetical protein AAG906_027574 [Vitis piasezkii]
MWLKEEGFKDLLRSWWLGFNFHDSFSFILYKKWVLLEETSQRHKRVMVEGGWQEYQFFCKMAKAHSKGTSLAKIKINGTGF